MLQYQVIIFCSHFGPWDFDVINLDNQFLATIKGTFSERCVNVSLCSLQQDSYFFLSSVLLFYLRLILCRPAFVDEEEENALCTVVKSQTWTNQSRNSRLIRLEAFFVRLPIIIAF